MKITPFLMFQGSAEEAMKLYASVFPGSEIVAIEHYAAGEPGKAGSVKQAVLRLAALEIRFFDSPVPHAFTFTPATSLFVDFDTREALDAALAVLGAGGEVLMPPGAYGFSTHFAWIQDRFGVSWQLNLP